MDQATHQPAHTDLGAQTRFRGLRERISARLGLQGKLVICFMALLGLTLGGTCWVFVSHTSKNLSDILGEQARQIAASLALASKPALATGQTGDLTRIGQDLIKSRNILFVTFLHADARPLAWASRDPDFQWSRFSVGQPHVQELMHVHTQHSELFGDYLEVVAPILAHVPLTAPTSSPPSATAAAPTTQPEEEIRPAGARLVGYVVVGMSQAREQAQLRRINLLAAVIGGVVTIISLPLAYLLVHRVFWPIRQLVHATNRIASGDLEARVAIHRPDVIGTLARAFNEMVQKVKAAQEELEQANAKLASANQQLEMANDQLAEANRDLEQKVTQRTAQLETANKRLSSEIAEKEDFLRAVSHDLNAPLRNISGMATMLLMKNREKFDEDVIHRLERIQKNVQVETDLIAELLELSRIKTRRQKMEAVDLVALVTELGEVFENDLNGRQIELVIDGELPMLNGERARLRQVFQNLIDNAIKYMGDKPDKRIHVGCLVRATEAEFYVRDTGIGIDPEDIDKVFFVFRRGKNTAAQNVAGKGVGLASVKSIIETYNGTIWVESKLGEGSTFKFTINGKFVATPGGREVEPALAPAAEPVLVGAE